MTADRPRDLGVDGVAHGDVQELLTFYYAETSRGGRCLELMRCNEMRCNEMRCNVMRTTQSQPDRRAELSFCFES